jgi:hypothetical protein
MEGVLKVHFPPAVDLAMLKTWRYRAMRTNTVLFCIVVLVGCLLEFSDKHFPFLLKFSAQRSCVCIQIGSLWFPAACSRISSWMGAWAGSQQLHSHLSKTAESSICPHSTNRPRYKVEKEENTQGASRWLGPVMQTESNPLQYCRGTVTSLYSTAESPL